MMKQDNRVISRIGARELTPKEVENIAGGITTMTVCTNPKVTGFFDDSGQDQFC